MNDEWMPNLPQTKQPRVVIVGAGFAGLQVANSLAGSGYQVLLIDKNNYHQFQPLFYQVAMAGLDPYSISFPLRRMFQASTQVLLRVATVQQVLPQQNLLRTNLGLVQYDHLIIATGADTNYFGMEGVKQHAYPMKSVAEALTLRNRILQNYEDALQLTDPMQRDQLMNVVVVGGGPTGVEVAGALAEMRSHVLPRDLPELNFETMKIYLVEGTGRLLNGMSDLAGRKAKEYLQHMGVQVLLNAQVTDYDGHTVKLASGPALYTHTLIWAAGIRPVAVPGLPQAAMGRGGRYLVDEYCRLQGHTNIYVLGDAALQATPEQPNGHPQVAQVAIQMGARLARNLKGELKGKAWQPFRYRNLGSMATVGRSRAVVDLPFVSFSGFFAWLVWLFVHLMAILGVKNKVFVFINWTVGYLTFNQSLRVIIRTSPKDTELEVA